MFEGFDLYQLEVAQYSIIGSQSFLSYFLQISIYNVDFSRKGMPRLAPDRFFVPDSNSFLVQKEYFLSLNKQNGLFRSAYQYQPLPSRIEEKGVDISNKYRPLRVKKSSRKQIFPQQTSLCSQKFQQGLRGVQKPVLANTGSKRAEFKVGRRSEAQVVMFQWAYNQFVSNQQSAMCERKIWKAQEDSILKQIYEVRDIKRWSEIARIMEKEYGIQGRNGKQCRQRYHNHLKGGINKDKWTQAEENDLIHLHAEHGNRWALISKLIPGRSENCVKNMLYSRMRRSIRLLNRFIFDNYRKQLKEIKISFIYRLIDFTQKSYKKPISYRNEQEIISIGLKNDLLMLEYAQTEASNQEKEHLKKLIADIHLFKRVNQRYRGNTTAKKSDKPSGKIKIDKKASDTSLNSDSSIIKCEASCEGLFSTFKIEGEESDENYLEYIADNHCQVTRVHKFDSLDSLDGNVPFLFNKESILERPIPMEVIRQCCEREVNMQKAESLECGSNDWQEYFIQFD